MWSARRFTILVAALATIAVPCAAQRRAVVRGPKGNVHVVRVHRTFRTNDRVIFRNYYRQHRLVITPLRPELAALIVRGKPLPTGVVRVALAAELLALVPPPAPGYAYAIIGNRIIMLNEDGVVDDILEDIFP